MTIAKDFASKAAIAFVAFAMIFTMFAPSAKAQSSEDLQTQINTLLAQIAALQGQGGTSSSVASGICPYTWTRDLKTGATGADVMKLQQFLNSNADTRVSASGVGSVGMETEYFGPATAAAVSKFQVMHRADTLTPAGLVNPTGYFGPSSRAKANSLCTSAPVVTPGEDDEDDEEVSGDLQGEASLVTYELNDGEESEVEEGEEDISIGEITVEFEDGDASISRIDVALVAGANDGDDDAFDVFETVSLWVDGDMVAEMDASDEDEYLDEDLGTIRFSGLDIVAMEDEEAVITVAVSVNSSVDNVSNEEPWILSIDDIRFFDADGVADTLGATGDDSLNFDIVEAGDGESLDLETSDEDPDAGTISLDEDDNVEAAIFAFDLSADDSEGDISLNEIVVNVTVATTASSVGDDLDNLVNDFRLEIGGDSYEADSYTGTGLTAAITFDIDGDTVVSEEETVTAVLFADFNDMDAVDEGSTIFASVSASAIDAEGVEDVTVGGASSKTGNTHTLRTEGLDLGEVTDGTGTSDSTQVVSGVSTDANYGTMFLTYEVTAFGDDMYIVKNNASRGASSTAGIAYIIEDDSTGSAVSTGTVSVSYDIAGADDENGYFQLEDGETYEMTVTVNSYNPSATGTFRLQVLSVGFASTEVAATDIEEPSELSDYESDAVAVQS